MMYKFKSQATGDLIMTQPVGDRVLASSARPPSPQGIIEVDQMPAAIGALESAVSRREPQAAADDGDGATSRGDAVSLRQRVWPMVEMMKRAHAEKQPIVVGRAEPRERPAE